MAPVMGRTEGVAVMARQADVSAARRTRLAPRRTGSIAERLAYLFDVVHAPGTRGYTAAEVARGVRAAGGSISDVYINKLLNGQRGEPSLRYLRMLAGFFGVPLTFFLDDDPRRSTARAWICRSACAHRRCGPCWPRQGGCPNRRSPRWATSSPACCAPRAANPLSSPPIPTILTTPCRR